MNEKLNTAMIEETLKAKREYAKTHFGIPNGADFPQFAQAFSESKEAATDALLHVLMISLGGKEVQEKMAADKGNPDAVLMAIVNTEAFRAYTEAVYFGYLLGRRLAEIEALEHMNIP